MTGISKIDMRVTLRDPKNYKMINFGNEMENFLHNYWGHPTSGLGFLPEHKHPKYFTVIDFDTPIEKDEVEVFLDIFYDFVHQELAWSPKIRLQAYSNANGRTFLFSIVRN